MDELPVRVSGLRRRFGRRAALEGVDLEVGAGQIVGLVGPNGSGKTTLLKALAGFLRPHGGDVRVFGRDPFRDAPAVMARARFVFAPPALFDGLTAREHLVHLSALRSRSMPATHASDVERALAAVGLGTRADDRVTTFSFGMRQRLALAQALLPLPELLVLDEPTDGLDPLAVLELRALLFELRRDHGTTILLSSHLLVEIEELVDRMLVLSDGRTLFHGPPSELVDGHVRLLARVSDPERAAAALAARGIACRRNGGAELELSRGALSLEEVRAVLHAEAVELLAFHEDRPPLERALLRTLSAGAGGAETGP